jgi:hypothetical protein
LLGFRRNLFSGTMVTEFICSSLAGGILDWRFRQIFVFFEYMCSVWTSFWIKVIMKRRIRHIWRMRGILFEIEIKFSVVALLWMVCTLFATVELGHIDLGVFYLRNIGLHSLEINDLICIIDPRVIIHLMWNWFRFLFVCRTNVLEFVL